jgi:hypothetical protein
MTLHKPFDTEHSKPQSATPVELKEGRFMRIKHT